MLSLKDSFLFFCSQALKNRKAENFLEWKVMYLLTVFITQNLIRVILSDRDFIWKHFIQKENILEIFQHLPLGTS